MTDQTFYWYDYEAFGLDPMNDRLAQFGGVRTDADFNVIGAPLMLYCKPSDDYLPNPASCLITGITPQQAQDLGVPEIEFIRRINEEFSQPNTCVLGYNNLRFDDEFTRYALYRNLLDPYAREWQNGCSRWDLLDVVRMTRALRPEGIVWPTNPEGLPSVRLENLTVANGIEHAAAHDALSDVYATLALARLVREKQPKLFDFALQNRGKQKVLQMLNLREQRPVLHISGMYPVDKGNMAVVMPLALHPANKNGVIVYDLSVDPKDLIGLGPKKIHERLFTRTDELPEGVARIPLKVVHANRCPVIAPITTLDGAAAKRYGIDLNVCRRNLEAIKHEKTLPQKVQKVFTESEFEPHTDPDRMLYGGPFFGDDDRAHMRELQAMRPEELSTYEPRFSDKRLPEMLFRLRARNYPETLREEERQRWQKFRHGRIKLDDYFAHIAHLRQEPGRGPRDMALLDELEVYGRQLA